VKQFKTCLQNAIDISSARMLSGDQLTTATYLDISTSLGHDHEGLNFCNYFNSEKFPDFCCLPSYKIELENPWTIGLGDFFIAGFISSLSNLDLTSS
jgi:hypothetical protein